MCIVHTVFLVHCSMNVVIIILMLKMEFKTRSDAQSESTIILMVTSTYIWDKEYARLPIIYKPHIMAIHSFTEF